MKKEEVLFEIKRIRLCSCLSWPNYRISFSLPLLFRQDLYITNKRVIHTFRVLFFFKQDFSQYYLPYNTVSKDVIKNVRADKNIFGRYLEINSICESSPWYRSDNARIRIYIPTAQTVCENINNVADKQ